MNDLDQVLLLISKADPKADESSPLQVAAYHGHLAIVEALIPVSDPLVDGSMPLIYAATMGHADVVKALVPVSDPLIVCNQVLCAAAKTGHLNVVQVLLPYSGEVGRAAALVEAAMQNQGSVIKLMMPHVDVSFTGGYLGNQKEWAALDAIGLEAPDALRAAWLADFQGHLPLTLAKHQALGRQDTAKPLRGAPERKARTRC